MFKHSLLALTVAAACSASPVALAHSSQILQAGLAGTANSAPVTVTGKVTSVDGKPVSGARIEVEGSRKTAYTNDQGEYTLADVPLSHIHLHVYSDRHIHGDNDLGDVSGNQQVDFVLEPASVENIVVTATAMQTSVLESVTPVTVIGAQALKKIQQPTLGETLKQTPGVHSTYFGPVSSSPIIRGNNGPRVKIVQNGLDVSDVSRVGPDHNVASNTSSATQVEVLRGPATLQFGSGAIGGVVNVVDNRIPRELPYGVEGEAEVSYSTVDEGKYGKVDVTGNQGKLAYHFDAYSRDTENVDIPGYASVSPDEDEPRGTLENSSMETTDFTAGLSWVEDEGYFGFAVEKLDNLYGVPGHAHAHGEEEHDHEGETEEEHEAHADEAEEGVMLDVDMTRYQLAGEWHSPIEFITNAKFAAAYTDYEHAEIEGNEIGTVFSNKSSDIRFSVTHEEVAGWHGVLGLQFNDAEYEAIGDEAFTPATDSNSYAVYLVEQRHVGDVTFELGGRVERTEYDAADTMVDLHVDHGDHDHDEEHEEGHEEGHDDELDHEDGLHTYDFNTYDFTATSLSAGFNWEYVTGQAVALTLSRSERAPSLQELFAAGQHLATETFEVGLVFDMDEDGEISESLRDVKEEVSTNIDLTFRKFTGDWGYSVSFFYNQANDYIYQSATGLNTLSEEHEEEESEAEHEAHADEGLPVFYFQQADADIWGMEAEGYYDLNDQWRVTVFSDLINAEVDGDNLPRIPPMRVGTEFSYVNDGLSASLGATWHDEQDQLAAYETVTDGYTLIDASVQYEFNHTGIDWVLFAKGDNLTDEEARVHTSFLKDKAPLPGRNLTLGVRAYF
ncbi:TonB-dependent receptor [Alteromonas sp. H39]|uniref:TonB-dependent receptor n=1 Tax=Alteromonas sp. H39 TaxID=3389876 RepID=UPI0039DF758B